MHYQSYLTAIYTVTRNDEFGEENPQSQTFSKIENLEKSLHEIWIRVEKNNRQHLMTSLQYSMTSRIIATL